MTFPALILYVSWKITVISENARTKLMKISVPKQSLQNVWLVSLFQYRKLNDMRCRQSFSAKCILESQPSTFFQSAYIQKVVSIFFSPSVVMWSIKWKVSISTFRNGYCFGVGWKEECKGPRRSATSRNYSQKLRNPNIWKKWWSMHMVSHCTVVKGYNSILAYLL